MARCVGRTELRGQGFRVAFGYTRPRAYFGPRRILVTMGRPTTCG